MAKKTSFLTYHTTSAFCSSFTESFFEAHGPFFNDTVDQSQEVVDETNRQGAYSIENQIPGARITVQKLTQSLLQLSCPDDMSAGTLIQQHIPYYSTFNDEVEGTSCLWYAFPIYSLRSGNGQQATWDGNSAPRFFVYKNNQVVEISYEDHVRLSQTVDKIYRVMYKDLYEKLPYGSFLSQDAKSSSTVRVIALETLQQAIDTELSDPESVLYGVKPIMQLEGLCKKRAEDNALELMSHTVTTPDNLHIPYTLRYAEYTMKDQSFYEKFNAFFSKAKRLGFSYLGLGKKYLCPNIFTHPSRHALENSMTDYKKRDTSKQSWIGTLRHYSKQCSYDVKSCLKSLHKTHLIIDMLCLIALSALTSYLCFQGWETKPHITAVTSLGCGLAVLCCLVYRNCLQTFKILPDHGVKQATYLHSSHIKRTQAPRVEHAPERPGVVQWCLRYLKFR